jgi:hypothetical protein
MKKIINLLTVVTISLTLYSCTKDDSTNNTTTNNPYTEDPNNFITATFLGKTLKTSGISTNPGLALSSKIGTTNNGSIINSNITITADGKLMNNAWGTTFNYPFQSLDAYITTSKTGNAIGNYTIFSNTYPPSSSSGSTITDLSNSKQYNFDTTTVFTVSSLDGTSFQGTYTGKLIDGTTKIPVTGTFKLRKS